MARDWKEPIDSHGEYGPRDHFPMGSVLVYVLVVLCLILVVILVVS